MSTGIVVQVKVASASSASNLSATFDAPVTPGNAIYCVGSCVVGPGLLETFTFTSPGCTFTVIDIQNNIDATPMSNSVAFGVPGGVTTVNMALLVPHYGDDFVSQMIMMEVSNVYALDPGMPPVDPSHEFNACNAWGPPGTPQVMGPVTAAYSNPFIIAAVVSINIPPNDYTAGPGYELNAQVNALWRDSGAYSCLGVETGNFGSPGTYMPTITGSQNPGGGTFVPFFGVQMVAILAVGNLSPLTLACPIVNTGQVGVPYASFLIASGGTPPYTFAIIGGALPPGLSLNASTGEISGTPTLAGSYTYTAQVTDSLGNTATATCTITISGGGGGGGNPNNRHLVYDIHGNAWYADTFANANPNLHYSVPQYDPSAQTWVLTGDSGGNVLVETPNTGDNGAAITCNVVTRELCPGGWAYAWFENPGVDVLPTNASVMNVQAVSQGQAIGVPALLQSPTRQTQAIVDIGGGQPLKSLGLQFAWAQMYGSGEPLPVVLYMMQWLAVPYPEPILNQRTKGTSHGLRGFFHHYLLNLAYVSPDGPVTITFNYDQPNPAGGNTSQIIFPATGVVGPDPVKVMKKIPAYPNKGKIVSYDIAAATPFFLWGRDTELWLKQWGSAGEYKIVHPFGSDGEEPRA